MSKLQMATILGRDVTLKFTHLNDLPPIALFCSISWFGQRLCNDYLRKLSESELFTGDTPKDNHAPGPVNRGVSP